MSDGSKEQTVEKSTDELLSETDDILSGMDDGGGAGSEPTDASSPEDAEASTGDLGTDATTANEASTDAASGGASGKDDRRFRKYFDPKSAGVSAVLVLAGALLGGAIPVIGALTQLLAVGAATFLHGTVASDSRYAETFVASGVVGGLVAFLTNLKFVAFGSAVPYLALTTGLLVLVALVGHYFGRDLRKGLTGSLDGGSGGQDDDVPGW